MNRLADWYIRLNICCKLIPFLLLYIAVCILLSKDTLEGDEGRYLGFADNLLHGFYSPPYPDIDLWNGPGYPVFLAPLIFFRIPLMVLRLINGLLLYCSLILSYKTFSLYSSPKTSLLFTFLLGLYYPIFELLPFILTECLAWFMMSLVCFLLVKTFRQNNISLKLILLSALSIATLAMIKVIFGYVILCMLFISIFMFLMPAFRSMAKKSALIFLLSFGFCLPWLIYTYTLTNKVMYWANSGTMSLYTMSSPFADELGDWTTTAELLVNPNHMVFMDSISRLKPLDREKAYKTTAIKNIKDHPRKYFTNWLANVGRILLSYPHSYTSQKITTYLTIIPNMFIIVAIVLSLAVSIRYYRRFPEGLIILFLLVMVYLFGSSLVSAFRRMFYITMPFWYLFLSYVFSNIISIRLKED